MYQSWDTENIHPTLMDLDKSGLQIFNDWWSTYVPEYKETLIRKIMHTYYFEQIGQETPDRFIHFINSHLENIMPYYNQLYASELIKINPLMNHYMTTNGRTIENLLTKANTSDDKIAKAIREFAGVVDTSGNENSTSNTLGSSERTIKDTGSYDKKGTEDITDHSKTDGTEDETINETKNGMSTLDKSENEKTTGTDTTSTDKTVTETPGAVQTHKTDYGKTDTGKETFTGTDTGKVTGNKHWTETLDDDSSTDTTTNLKESTNTDAEKDYADTPQNQLAVGPDGTQEVRKDFLTNVTWTDESSSHIADTKQNTKFTDDQTKEHTEDTSEDNSLNKSATTDTTKTAGGSDTETTSYEGDNVTVTNGTESIEHGKNVNTTTDSTTKENETSDTTRNLTSTSETAATSDKDWTEDGRDENTRTDKASMTNDVTASKNNSGTTQTREDSNTSQATTQVQEKTTEETTDTGTTTIMSGFMNVSSSALLEAFRKTFLNIDKMIIDELRDDFMLVY